MIALDKLHALRRDADARLLATGDRHLQEFLRLDSSVFSRGALPAKTKELLGLVAAGVLRNDDGIADHLLQCAKEGVEREELLEAFGIILAVGGTVTLPHLRRAIDTLQVVEREGFGRWFDGWRREG